jgi:thiamine biosynthesis lipoprotein
MGETRGLGAHPGGRPWEVALEAPSGALDEERYISIVNKAVATSGAAGFRLDEQGRFNHLFDPSTGACAYPARNLTVVAGQATAADALSTAFALMNEEGIKSILSRSGDAQSYITTESGTRAITAANEGPILRTLSIRAIPATAPGKVVSNWAHMATALTGKAKTDK